MTGAGIPAPETRQSENGVRQRFSHIDFLIVGPPGDPSHVAGAADALDAMRRIAAGHVRFISRGDESGTYEREQQLWKDAGVAPPATVVVSAGRPRDTPAAAPRQ